MSRRDVTHRRCWEAAVDAYRQLLDACDRLLQAERDPAMLLAGAKIRDELRESHRAALRQLDRHRRGLPTLRSGSVPARVSEAEGAGEAAPACGVQR
ncbi:hypothetical protein [Thermomonas fusca]